MGRSFLLILILLFSAGIHAHNKPSIEKSNSEKEFAPGKFVVKFKPDNSLNKVNQSVANSIVNRFNIFKQAPAFKHLKNQVIAEKLNLENILIMETSLATDINYIIESLKDDERIEYIEPLYKCTDDFIPNDPRYTGMYQLPQVQAPVAWDVQFGSEDIVVAIIDSGVDYNHEDLSSLIWVNEDEIPDNGIDDDNNGYIDDIRGWDFINDKRDIEPDPNEDFENVDNDPYDYHGHGTHVAGIAAAKSNNEIGVASLSGGAAIMPLRIGMRTVDGDGSGYTDWMAEAFIYAADNGARIANLSYGNSGQMIVDAAYYAFLNGVLITESAGNTNSDSPSSLGEQDWVISVASVNQDDAKAYYSNFGSYIEVAAPGGELFTNDDSWGILSTVPYPVPHYNGLKYDKFQGTSMAAPMVASLGALILSHEPNLSVIDLFSRIVETADDINNVNPAFVNMLGSGRINAYRALTENIFAIPKFKIIDYQIDDSNGNNNQLFDPGENIELQIRIRNTWKEAENVNVELQNNSLTPIQILNNNFNIENITGIVDTSEWEKNVLFSISCPEDVLPQTLALSLNVSSGMFIQQLPLRLALRPGILFVADFEETDGNELDFSKIYTEAFETNNLVFDVIDKNKTEFETGLFNRLIGYKTIVWGSEWNYPVLDSLDRVFLREFLDNGGSLFISGQDVAWEHYESQIYRDISFYENYIRAQYKADDANSSEIIGIEGDPIADGIHAEFYQEGRTANQQYPDIVGGYNGGEIIFKYPNGFGAATKYNGNHKIVNFAFGGFESVTDESIRNELMKRISNWLSGFSSYEVQKFKDTENTANDYEITFSAESIDEISSVALFWSNNGQQLQNKILMQSDNNGKYSASIPAQPLETNVQYRVLAETVNRGYILTDTIEFYVGLDSEPPDIELIGIPIRNSINAFGPYPREIQAHISDNQGIDGSTVKLNYWINDGNPSNITMEKISEDVYSGTFSFSNALDFGNQINYSISASDISLNQNMSTETFGYMVDSIQVIDDFEFGLDEWELDDKWDISSRNRNGNYSLSDSPDDFYSNNLNSTAMYKYGFDLSSYQTAAVKFYLRANLETNKDSLLFELSNDEGVTWESAFAFSSSSTIFKEHAVDVSSYTGVGNDYVTFRFRLQTDGEGQRDGVWIDDVTIAVSKFPQTGIELINDLMPADFSLQQNYPNPFNPGTSIKYAVPSESRVAIKIYDMLGQLVETAVDGLHAAGYYNFNWDASKFASGIYIYSIQAESVAEEKKFNQVKKMMLIK